MEFFVFDTNILLSAVFNENSTPGLALKKARTIGTLLISDESWLVCGDLEIDQNCELL